MLPKPRPTRSIRTYSDIETVLQRAKDISEAKLTFATAGQAQTFIARANTYRRLLRSLSEERGGEFACEYDHLKLCRAKGSTEVFIRQQAVDAKFEILDASPAQPAAQPEAPVLSAEGLRIQPVTPEPAADNYDSFLEEFNEGLKNDTLG